MCILAFGVAMVAPNAQIPNRHSPLSYPPTPAPALARSLKPFLVVRFAFLVPYNVNFSRRKNQDEP